MGSGGSKSRRHCESGFIESLTGRPWTACGPTCPANGRSSAWAESQERGDENSFDAEDAAAIHRALDRLDVKHCDVLVLHFLNDFSLAEIASIVGCPDGTVKSRIYHAKRALKEALKRGGYGTDEK